MVKHETKKNYVNQMVQILANKELTDNKVNQLNSCKLYA